MILKSILAVGSVLLALLTSVSLIASADEGTGFSNALNSKVTYTSQLTCSSSLVGTTENRVMIDRVVVFSKPVLRAEDLGSSSVSFEFGKGSFLFHNARMTKQAGSILVDMKIDGAPALMTLDAETFEGKALFFDDTYDIKCATSKPIEVASTHDKHPVSIEAKVLTCAGPENEAFSIRWSLMSSGSDPFPAFVSTPVGIVDGLTFSPITDAIDGPISIKFSEQQDGMSGDMKIDGKIFLVKCGSIN